MPKSLISIVTPCFNEEDNVLALSDAIRKEMSAIADVDYEHIFIDNASTDSTVDRIKELCAKDQKVKLIVNSRNFGHIRSPYYGLLQGRGEAVVLMASDLQDPPTLLPEFIRLWREGNEVVMGVKTESEESRAMFFVRSAYYELVGKLTDVILVSNFTGFGLYDQRVVRILNEVNDPYPYFRGLIADLGFKSARVDFAQPRRKRGFTKNNFYSLYDMAMLGITNHSKVPLRIATFSGFAMSAISLLLALGYLIAKILFWDWLTVGTAPLLIGLFLFSSVQLFFIGILGEYVGAIHTQVLKRPLVIERERINF